MSAWWDSVETITSVTWWLRWLGLGLTLLGVLVTAASFKSARRVEVLKDTRERLRQSAADVRERELQVRLGAAEGHLRDRTFSNRQEQLIDDALRQMPEAMCNILVLNGDPEAARFAENIARILRRNGWYAPIQPVMFPNVPVGLQVTARNLASITRATRVLRQALTRAGFPPLVVFEEPENPTPIQDGLVTLIVGAKR